MSSFVTSDYTVLAIVEGMRKHKLISKSKRESKDVADALRVMNEYMVNAKLTEHEVKGSARWVTELQHKDVEAIPRKFTDGEMLAACESYIKQVDNGKQMIFDFITLLEAVEMLKQKVIAAGKADKTIKAKCFFGNYKYYVDDGTGEFVEIHKLYGWDLEAEPIEMKKAA